MPGVSLSNLRRFSRTTGSLVAVLGCLVLAGWALDVPVLKGVAPGLATMSVQAALGFVLTGLSLVLQVPASPGGPPSPSFRLAARALAAVAAILGALVGAEYLFGWTAGFDQWVFDDPSPAAHPGRMSPLSALNFLLLGVSLMTLDVEDRRGHRPAQFLALGAGVVGFVATIGYALSIRSLHRVSSLTSMALHTAIAFCLIGLAVLCARPDRGIPALLFADGPGGTTARRIVPGVFLLTVAVGWITLEWYRTGLYTTEIAVGLTVISTIVFLSIIVYTTGLAIEKEHARHRLAEQAVQRSELRKQASLDASLDAVITIDERGRIVEFNPAAERLFGYSSREALGQDMAELIVPPERRDEHRRGLERQVSTGESHVLGRRIEMPARKKDGGIFPAELSITRVETGGAPPMFTGYVRDITDRKRVDEDLRKSEERFRLIANASSDVVWDWSLLENTIWWSEGVQTVFGYDSIGASADPQWWARCVDPTDLPRVLAGMWKAVDGTGATWQDEYRFRRADGSVATVVDRGAILRDASGRATRMIGTTADMTERRGLEEQLRQSQKIEAVGQLAGGVAHDFNNLLTAVLGYADLLEPELYDRPDLAQSVSEIRKAGERAATLTRQLLAFSRRQVLEPRLVDLNEIVRNLENMLRPLLGASIDLASALQPSLAPVLADAGQMEQVIVNLAVNSRDAMPHGGKLTIETMNVDLDQSYANRHAGGRAGSYVMLAVADTGEGMDAVTQARIFEPFFTTKGPGKGTGLGLSTVYGIVKQSGGHVWVYSEVGKGTTFKVYLPRATGDVAPQEAPPPQTLHDPATETILLVEDEASLRALGHRILSGLGYTVLVTSNGEDALKAVRQHAGQIDLVLTDVVMPGMGGVKLAAAIREIHPRVPVIFMSGYTDDAVIRHNVLEAGTAFLQKPFTPTSLGNKVREALSAQP